MSRYDDVFYEYVTQSALSSAQKLLPLLSGVFPVRSVLDVGCGEGGWLKVWSSLGAETLLGLDGGEVQPDRLLIPGDCFQAVDLSRPFSLSRRFDLVQSLEVGEHLPESAADGFVASLVEHAPMVLFSAATVGQGGDHHINEQPLSYWRDKFAEHDYVAVDAVRPAVSEERQVAPWYRYNTLLYVRRHTLEELPVAWQARVIPPDQPVPDICPALYTFRKKLTSCLSVPCVTGLAKWKEKIIVALLGFRRKRNSGDA